MQIESAWNGRNTLIVTRFDICKFFGKEMQNFFTCPKLGSERLVTICVSTRKNNLNFASKISEKKLANVKKLLYLCIPKSHYAIESSAILPRPQKRSRSVLRFSC